MLKRPSIDALDERLRGATVALAQRLRDSGAQAWLVGGAVRDMALGKPPKDIDLATDARPEAVEALFERTLAVGRAFGTIIVLVGDVEAQVTTFRSERGHHDARRPSAVSFSTRLEEDAARRDFTCNALYLDPLSGALADPCGGLSDLEAGLLRSVGDARQRFEEDGLRLVRMARLAAANGLTVESQTFAAARGALHALRGVSAERRLGELRLIFERASSATALELLEQSGVLEALCPGIGELAAGRARAWRSLQRLDEPPGAAAGLAHMFDPLSGAPSDDQRLAAHADLLLQALKPSRVLADEVRALWRLQRVVLRTPRVELTRALAIRTARESAWPLSRRLLEARAPAPLEQLAALDAWVAPLAEHERWPAALVSSADLARANVPRGPRWKELLERAEQLQLDLLLGSREQALDWLAREAARSTAGDL